MATGTAGSSTDPSWVLKKDDGVRAVSGVSSALSIVGSALIIFTYLCFPSLRTRARLILVHLALADMGVGLANLIGIIVDFDRFYVHNHTPEETEPFSPNISAIADLCKTQAFFAEFCTLCSVLWTTSLAVYMYLLIVSKSQKQMQYFTWFSYVFCYGMALLVSVWMLCTGRLGYAPYDSSGWCSIIVVKPYIRSEVLEPRVDIMSDAIGYDLWIFLTIVLTALLYISVYCYVKQQFHQLRQSTDAMIFWQAMYNIDYKFIAIPLAFIFLRIWSVILNVLLIYLHMPAEMIAPAVLKTLMYLAGIGDSGQGFINAILFVAFTHSVRKQVMLCTCCKWRQRHIQQDSRYSETRYLIKSSNPIGYDSNKKYSTLPREDISETNSKENKYSPIFETVTPVSGRGDDSPSSFK